MMSDCQIRCCRGSSVKISLLILLSHCSFHNPQSNQAMRKVPGNKGDANSLFVMFSETAAHKAHADLNK